MRSTALQLLATNPASKAELPLAPEAMENESNFQFFTNDAGKWCGIEHWRVLRSVPF
jgi:hypothetical protein